ncbi:hypothetical protein BJV74DRAFT_777907 [Russula compacta]|nr:hypothetical protein BJV74DRAFT_777907 [Russula compacta]
MSRIVSRARRVLPQGHPASLLPLPVPSALVRALAISLRLLPSLAKVLAYLLVVLNLRSLPFAWHVSLFWPVAKVRWLAWCARIRTLSLSSAVREAAARKFLDDLSPVGDNPLDKTIVFKTWAGPDDCDYNWHLSNSSYPKILDSARMKSALAIFPYYGRAGGWIALAGTHFHFIREIPMFARYEVRSQIVGWDHKWFYIVHRFVTHRKAVPRASRSKNEISSSSSAPASSKNGIPPNSASAAPFLSIHTPSTPLANLTPSPSSANLQAIPSHPGAATAAAAAAAAAVAAAEIAPERDGATLHCVSVNVMVFKFGKITVPPALVFAGEGFGATPAQGTEARARALGLGLDRMRELYCGAWRAVPEGSERWWDEAVKGLEGRMKARIGKVMGVREGLEGALQVRNL